MVNSSSASGMNTGTMTTAITYYGVLLPGGHETDNQSELVFENREQALKLCKKFKGARFKCFTDKDEAVQFTRAKQTVEEVNPGVIKELPSEKLPFSAPSPQDMLVFRKIIEAGDKQQFLQCVWKNPRYLISSGDGPTMIRERYRYHTLLQATFKKCYDICKAVLDTITDPNFIALLYINDTEDVRKNRMFYLLDTYLNTPDKFLNETALHFACKMGSVEIVELLTSYPECDRERRNNKGEAPIDIICTSCKEADPEIEAEIRGLLSQRYFVPVLRVVDFSAPAVVGKPWSPDVSPGGPDSGPCSPVQMPKHPADSQMMLQALAGPMSPKEAEIFYQKMKTPPVNKSLQSGSGRQQSDQKITPKKLFESRLLDLEKGVERVGRNVAKDLRVPWSEYWAFLDDFCDLSSPEGLDRLEEYFRSQRQSSEMPEVVTQAASPMSEICEKLNALRLQSPIQDRNEPEMGSDQFFTPPSTPPSPFYEILPFYISGSEPSKVDVDVLRVIVGLELDNTRHSNIIVWKESMEKFNEEHLSRLRTPATTSKIRKSPADSPLSPRVPSIRSLNSPRKTRISDRERTTPVRLSQRFDNLDT